MFDIYVRWAFIGLVCHYFIFSQLMYLSKVNCDHTLIIATKVVTCVPSSRGISPQQYDLLMQMQ